MITSKTNQKLKRIRKLLNSAQERRKTGLFVIEGTRIFREAPKNLIEEVFLSEDVRGIDLQGFENAETVARSLFRELSDTVNPQGVLAVVRRPSWTEPDEPGRYLLLDGVRDPGNLGTMVRTAEAAGVKAIYMTPDCADLYNPKVVRSTMGSIFRVPVFPGDLLPVIEKLQKRGTKVYVTSLAAERSFREADLANAGIVIGSEAEGVSSRVLSSTAEHIKIPMAGQVESLNAAVSAAILMFAGN